MRFLGAGLLLGSSVGCIGDSDGPADMPTPVDPAVPTMGTLASLQRATSCDDLLTKIQDDAIAKLKMTVVRAKARAAMQIAQGGTSGGPVFGGADAGSAVTSPTPGRGDVAVDTAGNGGAAPTSPPIGTSDDGKSESSGEQSAGPVGASGTNTQVADVDEADFVKVVENGRGIFLLHGSSLFKLKSWPAAETALVGTPVKIEGSPSEMFVTDAGKAVVFSSVNGGYGGGIKPPIGDAIGCTPEGCGSFPYGGSGNTLKITVVDVSSATAKVERELYYEGWYVSSRRYEAGASDVVRAVIQASSKYSGLFEPEVDWYDAWGRPFDEQNIATQLDEWALRTTGSIRKTTLDDWLPGAEEVVAGKREKLDRACGDYFVPVAGLSDYGLTHVVSLDVATPGQKVGGVTIVGATSTVYSSAEKLVLAQPDYRWGDSLDFGVASQQQTALHLFNLAGATTGYVASGWVPGHLPQRNPQFGIDVAKDGTIRLATTGFVRNQPTASAREPAFWQQHTENYVVTARPGEGGIGLVGKSPKLGHEGESVYSARFVGDRAYVVTFRQTDPLIVVDVETPASPTVLGEIEIPGFSEYMHPLDANHLITVGQSGSWGIRLQLFDVTNPASIPQPKVLDFGGGTSTPVSYEHKAFTFFDGVLAMPLSGFRSDSRRGYLSTLQLIRVDASAGFTRLGEIDHAPLYADNGYGVRCGYCDVVSGCYDYVCSYSPEVRRGHFVKGESATYVYSFSHAGVLVNDLASLAQPLARVGLPAPQYEAYPVAVDGGMAAPRDGGTVVVVDAGIAPEQDAGSAMLVTD